MCISFKYEILNKIHSMQKVSPPYRPNEIPDKHKNKLMWKNYFFIYRRLKNNFTCFFYKKYFYKQHQAKI